MPDEVRLPIFLAIISYSSPPMLQMNSFALHLNMSIRENSYIFAIAI